MSASDVIDRTECIVLRSVRAKNAKNGKIGEAHEACAGDGW